jgi:hypothetical protein
MTRLAVFYKKGQFSWKLAQNRLINASGKMVYARGKMTFA